MIPVSKNSLNVKLKRKKIKEVEMDGIKPLPVWVGVLSANFTIEFSYEMA